MVYSFQNRKLFFDFKHIILKSTHPAKTHPQPRRVLIGTHLEPA